jgi:hypothetical protein
VNISCGSPFPYSVSSLFISRDCPWALLPWISLLAN